MKLNVCDWVKFISMIHFWGSGGGTVRKIICMNLYGISMIYMGYLKFMQIYKE